MILIIIIALLRSMIRLILLFIKYSINWFNPGGNIYNENELCAVKQDGKKVKLTSGRVTGSNGFGEIMNYSYKLSAADKTAFVYYEVNVKYRDTIWGRSGSAQALFILN